MEAESKRLDEFRRVRSLPEYALSSHFCLASVSEASLELNDHVARATWVP